MREISSGGWEQRRLLPLSGTEDKLDVQRDVFHFP